MIDSTPGTGDVTRSESRRDAFDKSDCGNGQYEDGDYPCEPKVLFGGGYAECQVCGRVASWSETEIRETDV